MLGGAGAAAADARRLSLTLRCAVIFTSYRDVAQCLRLCVTAPDTLRFGVFFCISNNSRGYRDIEHTREVLGYEPQDSADDFEF